MRSAWLLPLLALHVSLGACATAVERREPPPPPVAAPPRPVVVTPTPPAEPSPREKLAARHRQMAEAFERDGNLRRALDEWKVALTINPDDPVALPARKTLEGRIEGAVAERARQGREALGRGAHLEARRQLLAVLALDPANATAFELLRSEVKDVRFVAHTVRAGETLATIAQRYYGDRSRSEVIWETNQLPPNPKLVAGTTLKVPEIPGVPFLSPQTSPRELREGPPPIDQPAPTPREETPEANPLFAEAKDSYEKGEYTVALVDVERFLASNPRNSEGLELKKEVLYRLGKIQLDLKQYDQSWETLSQLARLAPNYEDSATLLRQLRPRLIQQHYNEGLRLYRNEKLEEAIAEWQVVLGLDPQHANAKRNIDQAERVLKGHEQRKKK